MKSHFKPQGHFTKVAESRKRGLNQWQKCDEKKQSMKTLCEKVCFKERLKTAGQNDELWRIASDRLFHARGPATAKAPSPNVERRFAGTARSVEDAERRRRRGSVLLTGQTDGVFQVERRRSVYTLLYKCYASARLEISVNSFALRSSIARLGWWSGVVVSALALNFWSTKLINVRPG